MSIAEEKAKHLADEQTKYQRELGMLDITLDRIAERLLERTEYVLNRAAEIRAKMAAAETNGITSGDVSIISQEVSKIQSDVYMPASGWETNNASFYIHPSASVQAGTITGSGTITLAGR